MDKTARFHGEHPVTLKHPSYVKSVLPQPFGLPYILTGAEDEEIRVWDSTDLHATKSKPLSVVSGHCGEVTAMAPWSKCVNGRSVPHVVTAGLDGTVRAWTVQGEPGKVKGVNETELLHPPKLDYEPTPDGDGVALTEEEERELAELMSDDD